MSRALPQQLGAGAAPAPETVYLLPGEARVAMSPARLTTILGSCVAVCLFDRRLRIGGMNHFLLPGSPPARGDEPLRWGETSTEALVLDLLCAGATAPALEAKVFGGAHVAQSGAWPGVRIGDRNAETAFAVLARIGIPVAARAVGGAFGRRLVFEPHTGDAWVKELTGGR